TTGCGPANYATGNAICTSFGCQNVGDVLGGGLGQAIFNTPQPNPLMGGATIPGPWSDPLKPEAADSKILETLVVIPATAAPPEGYPTIVFGHGLGSSK